MGNNNECQMHCCNDNATVCPANSKISQSAASSVIHDSVRSVAVARFQGGHLRVAEQRGLKASLAAVEVQSAHALRTILESV